MSVCWFLWAHKLDKRCVIIVKLLQTSSSMPTFFIAVREKWIAVKTGTHLWAFFTVLLLLWNVSNIQLVISMNCFLLSGFALQEYRFSGHMDALFPFCCSLFISFLFTSDERHQGAKRHYGSGKSAAACVKTVKKTVFYSCYSYDGKLQEFILLRPWVIAQLNEVPNVTCEVQKGVCGRFLLQSLDTQNNNEAA